MSQDVISVLRRIRACEGEAAAQVVLDHFVRAQADEAYERAAQACESEAVDYEATKHTNDFAYNAATNHCAAAIRALKSEAPTNEIGNARMGGE